MGTQKMIGSKCVKIHMTTFQLLYEGILDSKRNDCRCLIDAGHNGINMIEDYEVVVDYGLTPTEFVGWEFPKERFVTYEKTDEDWCRYCGIGKELNEWVPGQIIIDNMEDEELNNHVMSFIVDKIKMKKKPGQEKSNDYTNRAQYRISHSPE
jgi:hypothetical protein